jgi:hypothetical protein
MLLQFKMLLKHKMEENVSYSLRRANPIKERGSGLIYMDINLKENGC